MKKPARYKSVPEMLDAEHPDIANKVRDQVIENLRFEVAELEAEIAKLQAQKKNYNELIMAVGNKYKDETRHETALRYIKQAEESDKGATAIHDKLYKEKL